MFKNAKEKIQQKAVSLWGKVKISINNEKGDISAGGKILIACLVIVALLSITKFALDRTSSQVENSLNKIDQEIEKWN
ncbi:MAG: hypothetical protein AB2421_18350 [Thermotaleaceae bacterium]